jgi:cystathionine beta-synthase
MANIHDSILGAVGHTPLVRLSRLSRGLNAEILVKVETVNPGGSIKDRVAVTMVAAAEADGRLKPGGTIVEATAGNTGVGLAQIAAVRGYKAIFVLPDKMSEDKISLLRAYGAEVVITPTNVAPDSPESYNGVADRLAREIPGAWRPNQFANDDNPRAHYETTGPEIWDDTNGRLDILVAGMGTGGTISGTARYLREQHPGLLVVGADIEGSILSGDSPKPWKVEGIGEDFIPRTFDRQVIDEFVRVSDKESFHAARRLAREEGILAGGSAGTALAGALKYAARLQTKKRIVVILPDTGRNYLTKVYSDRWMQENGFLDGASTAKLTLGNALEQRESFPELISVAPSTTLADALATMQKYGISQLPVLEGGTPVGSLQESSFLKHVWDGLDFRKQQVNAVMGQPLPTLDTDTEVTEAYRLLLSGSNAVLVTQGGIPRSVLTRIDLIDFLSRRTA